jgi:hypothetical protein
MEKDNALRLVLRRMLGCQDVRGRTWDTDLEIFKSIDGKEDFAIIHEDRFTQAEAEILALFSKQYAGESFDPIMEQSDANLPSQKTEEKRRI